jgi:hypothetical protein
MRLHMETIFLTHNTTPPPPPPPLKRYTEFPSLNQSSDEMFALEQVTKAQRGTGVTALFFNLGARWGGSQRHAPAALPPGKRPDVHCIGGWLGPRADLENSPPPPRDLIPGPSNMQRVAIQTELSQCTVCV